MKRLFCVLALSFLSLTSGQAAFPRFWHFPYIPFLPAGTRFTADAGTDQAVTITTATMAASVTPSASYSYSWTQVSGPSSASFNNSHILNPVITRGASVGTYVFRLTSTLGVRYSTDTVTITYGSPANTPPFVTPPAANVNTNEDSAQSVSFTVGDTETAAGSLTVLAVSSNTNVLRQAGISVTSPSASSRTVTMTPVANASGTSTITVSVTDDGGAIATMSFTATWTAVNDPPTLSSIGAQSGTEDTTKTINFTVGDVETPASSLIAFGSSSSPIIQGITVTGAAANRTATIQLVPNSNGVASVTIAVTDGSATTSETFNLTIATVNDPPVISASSLVLQATNNVASVPITLTVSDVEDAASSLAVVATSSSQGVLPDVSIFITGAGGSRSLTVIPAASGTATITVTVLDSSFASASLDIALTVGSGNTAPSISNPGAQSTSEDVAKVITYTISDSQTAAANLVLHSFSSDQTLVPDSSLVLGGTTGTRTVTATPAANTHGSLTITTYVVDTGGLSATNTLTLTINSVNDCPTSPQIAAQSTAEDVAKAVAFSVSDVDGDTLTITGTSSNTGLVSNDGSHIAFSGTGNNRTVTLTPLLNQTGQTTIAIKVDDGSCSVTNSFLLSVAPVNDPPVLAAISAQSTTEDTAMSAIALTISDPESASSALTVSAISSNPTLCPVSGMVFGGSGGNRTLTITPGADQNGSATITVSCSDGTNSVSQSFTLTVSAVNDAPTIANLSNQTLVQGASSASATATVDDIDSTISALTLSATSSDTTVLPLSGITFSGTGTARTVTFTPATVGSATVRLIVSDGSLTATNASFVVTKPAPINNAPTISGPGNQPTSEDTNLAGLAVTIGDAETPAASLVLTASSSNPALVASLPLGGSGTARTLGINLVANASGTATISLVVTDAGGLSATNQFILTVSAVNDPPVLTLPGAQTMSEDVPFTFNVSVSDVETAASSLTLTAISSNPALIANTSAGINISTTGGTRTVTVTPVLNQSGTATLTFTLSDGSGGTANGSVAVTVQPVNDPPTISGLINTTVALNTAAVETFSINDVETPAASLTVSGSSSQTTLVPNANIVFSGSGAGRTVTVTPATGQSGSAVITVLVNDGNGGTGIQSFTMTVTPAGGGRTFYAAPNGVGSSSNNGLTTSTAWDINSVLSKSTKSLTAGDTVYLLDGTYTGRYVFSGAYGSSGHIVFRSLNRNFGGHGAIFDRNNAASGDGAVDFASGSTGIWFWDLNGTDTAPRNSPNPNIDRGNPLYVVWRGDNNKVINSHLSNGANGIGVEDDASIPSGNFEIYGCITAYNGEWLDDCQHGHGLYLQPKHPTDQFLIADCFSHNNMGQGLQARTGDQSITLHNLEVNGLVAFNNGFPCGSASRNFFSNAGGDVDYNFKFRSNITYYPAAGGPGGLYTVRPETDSGHIGSPPNIHSNFLIDYNFIIHGDTMFGRQTPLNVYSNTFVSTSGRYGSIYLNEFSSSGTINFNTYYGPQPYAFDVGGSFSTASTAQWQAKGFGANDVRNSGDITSTTVWIRPNKYDPKLVHVIVSNPSGGSTVGFSMPQLANGQAYDVYSVTDWDVRFFSGVYSGQVNLPMTGMHMRAMVQCSSGCGTLAGVSPEPFFGAFVFVLN